MPFSLAHAQTIVFTTGYEPSGASEVSLTFTVASGGTIVVAIGSLSTGNATMTVGDTLSNSFTQEAGVGAYAGYATDYHIAQVWDAPNTGGAGSDTVNVTPTGSSNARMTVSIFYLSGEYGAIDGKSAGESGSASVASVAPITITGAHAVIAATECGNAGGYFSYGGGLGVSGFFGGYSATGFSAGLSGTALTFTGSFGTYPNTMGSCGDMAEVVATYPDNAATTVTDTTTTTTTTTATVTDTTTVQNTTTATVTHTDTVTSTSTSTTCCATSTTTSTSTSVVTSTSVTVITATITSTTCCATSTSISTSTVYTSTTYTQSSADITTFTDLLLVFAVLGACIYAGGWVNRKAKGST